METADLIWAAGFFEAEGTVTVCKAGRYTTDLVAIANTDFDVITFFLNHWGGNFTERIPSNSPNARPARRWIVQHGQAEIFIRAIQPFLRTSRVKRKVDLFLQVRALRTRGKQLPAYHHKIDAMRLQMRELNHRGSLPFRPN